ncbi:sugar phosphate isomerase/epimerase [uncultured Draconibacterium sp.]|uniref:sugar phosphate isomerase/epimerase family protein n=1 Tax=uncultured Draconibacterium sp. TaxID=1573823 RepID=UPI003217607A
MKSIVSFKNITLILLFLVRSTFIGAQENNKSSLHELGIILNTVGAEMDADYVSTLKKLKEIGYTCIEAGYYGESADDYYKLLSAMGLKSIAFGANLDQLEDDLGSLVKIAKSLHTPYLVCYYPWNYDWEKRAELISREGAIEAAEKLNSIGKECKDAGLQLVFHNHDIEFVKFDDGSTAFDIIMENTDPEYVAAEMDVYWVTKGGSDPVKQLEKYKGRIPLLHIKDMADNEEKGFECVGEGTLDFERIVKVAKTNGVTHFIIEHDKPNNGIHCAQVGYETLNTIISKL